MSIDASVVIPVTVPNAVTYAITRTALETLRETTDAEVLVLCNNSPMLDYRRGILFLCEKLGLRYEYVDGPFSMSKCFNYGTDNTKGAYIAYSTADVVFFPGWLDNLIRLWEKEPNYWLLCPAGWHEKNYGIAMNPDVRFADYIQRNHNPNGGGTVVLKRESGYRFDEHFSTWELDADVQYHMERNNLAGGICYGSRVDHMVEAIRRYIDNAAHYGPAPAENVSTYLRRKWNLPSPSQS